jgi:hypothetical protein
MSKLRRDLVGLLRASYSDAPARAFAKLGYAVDQELSSEDTFVVDGSPTVVHRGSTTASDWLVADRLILSGSERGSKRFDKARLVTFEAKIKYHPRKVNAVGHSLGGRLAELSDANGEIITYNKAASPLNALQRLPGGERQTDVRDRLDAISLASVAQRGGRKVEYVARRPRKTSRLGVLTPAPVAFARKIVEAHSIRE